MTATWNRREAWWGLLLNALILPGLGTVMVTGAGSGWIQVVASAIATALVLSGQPMTMGFGLGLLVGVIAWSVEGSVRAIRRAS